MATSLSTYADYMAKNRESWNSSLPKCAQASEAINQGFQTFLSDIDMPMDKLSGYALAMLAFGSHYSWVDAHFQTIAGNLQSGLGDFRRAIEYVCYAAKVKSSEKRAEDWMNQKDDQNARRRFSMQCSLPLSYRDKKYRGLWSILLVYEQASYYGVHGGFESLTGSHKGITEQKVEYTHPANNIPFILSISTYVTFLGYDILLALKDIYEPYFKMGNQFPVTLSFVEESVKKGKEEAYKMQNQGALPDAIKKVIQEGNPDVIEQLFKEMIEREVKRTQRPD